MIILSPKKRNVGVDLKLFRQKKLKYYFWLLYYIRLVILLTFTYTQCFQLSRPAHGLANLGLMNAEPSSEPFAEGAGPAQSKPSAEGAYPSPVQAVKRGAPPRTVFRHCFGTVWDRVLTAGLADL